MYAEDSHELAVLEPIGAELEQRGARVRATADFDEPADVGLYSCHTSCFFDHARARWRRPANRCSVQSLHDLALHDDAQYFTVERWHLFDLGLLPGPLWASAWERARAAGVRGPVLGMRTIGWPKMDHVERDPAGFQDTVDALRRRLGTAERAVLLLACSWSRERQLADLLAAIDLERFAPVVKYPASVPPPPDNPWAARLNAAIEELERARARALATPGVTVADDDADIMALVEIADVVVSDGSNVLHEGVLAGTPGVCVTDWPLAAGVHGELSVPPRVLLPGVLSGDRRSLPSMLRVVLAPEWRPLVAEGADALVERATRGRAAALAADAVEEALRWSDTLPSEQRAELDERAAYDDSELHRAVAELHRVEAELHEVHEVLRQSNEREERAMEQLRRYEKERANRSSG